MTRTARRLLFATALTLVLMLGAALLLIPPRITPHVRERAVAALKERLESDVDLASLKVAFLPRPQISGTNLTLRHRGRHDVAPLIQIESYSASAGLWGLISSPMRLETVELERLDISIPPGGVDRASGAPRPGASPLIIDRIVSRAARLEIVPRDPGKLPRVFEIHDLVMLGLGVGRGATFQARLTNPKPHGEITTRGSFGPWQSDEPRLTPLRGEYEFTAANLNPIKGIGGTLSSVGTYSGVLERIEVQGQTETPDFSIDLAAQPVALSTRFHAIVDGTNGDTFLERVEARIGETPIVAHGAVVRTEDVKGRRISLNVTIDDGRIEDVLRLGVKASTPLMTGRMRMRTMLLLPAGDRDVIDKLQLAGTFSLDEARFASMNIQQRINTLSQRGRGESGDDGPSVVSRLSGAFTLRDGVLTFTDLSFGVPGAVVAIAGTYDLRREILDFRGHLLLDASLAETTSGWKAVVARVTQPLFRRPGGGSKLPIRISGPREKPEFGLDVRRAIGPG